MTPVWQHGGAPHITLFRNHPDHFRFHLDNTAITTTNPHPIIKKLAIYLSNVRQIQAKKTPDGGPGAKMLGDEQRRSKREELPLAHLQSTIYTPGNEVRKGPAHVGSSN